MKKSELKALIREVVKEACFGAAGIHADAARAGFPKLTDLTTGKVLKIGDKIDTSQLSGDGAPAKIVDIGGLEELVVIRYMSGENVGKKFLVSPQDINAEFR